MSLKEDLAFHKSVSTSEQKKRRRRAAQNKGIARKNRRIRRDVGWWNDQAEAGAQERSHAAERRKRFAEVRTNIRTADGAEGLTVSGWTVPQPSTGELPQGTPTGE